MMKVPNPLPATIEKCHEVIIFLVNEVNKKVEELEETVERQNQIIKQQSQLIEKQNRIIENQNQIIQEQAAKILSLENQVRWFKQEVFGVKSEKKSRLSVFPLPEKVQEKPERKSSQKHPFEGNCGVSGLRFNEGIEIIVQDIPNPDIEGLTPDQYELVRYEEVDKLSYKKSYCVIRYRRGVYKLKATGSLSTAPAPRQVIPGALADTAFLVSMILDKILYHIPLYRIHQRIQDAGIEISRRILTTYFHTLGDSLELVFQYHLESVLEGSILTLDETRIKAGIDEEKRKMNTGFFWGIYSERKECVYMFFPNREHANVHTLLNEWKEKAEAKFLLSDDYGAYTAFAKTVQTSFLHALCWSHCRRGFYQYEAVEPVRVRKILSLYEQVYKNERSIREQGLEGEDKKTFRRKHSGPVVDTLFTHLAEEQKDPTLLPQNPYRKALNYVLDNEKELRVFLEHPNVPIDTNHMERQNKKIAIGRKNYLFCSTEEGAHYLGIFYSLLITAKELGIDCREYLTDILTRMPHLTTEEIRELIPYRWKQNQQLLHREPPFQQTG